MTAGSRKSASCRSSSTNSYSRVANHVGKLHKGQFKKKKIWKANGDRYVNGLTIGHHNQGSLTIACDYYKVMIMNDDHTWWLSHDDIVWQSCMTIIAYDRLTWSSQMIVMWWYSLIIVLWWLSHVIFRHDHHATIVVGQSCRMIIMRRSCMTIMGNNFRMMIMHKN